MGETRNTVHGTALRIAETAVLLVGPPRSGKSSLALTLIKDGATLIADDRVILTATPAGVEASCPPTIVGLIEARGIGILNAPTAPPTCLSLVVDLGKTERERVPPPRDVTLMGQLLPLLWCPDSPHFAVMLRHLLIHGRSAR